MNKSLLPQSFGVSTNAAQKRGLDLVTSLEFSPPEAGVYCEDEQILKVNLNIYYVLCTHGHSQESSWYRFVHPPLIRE